MKQFYIILIVLTFHLSSQSQSIFNAPDSADIYLLTSKNTYSQFQTLLEKPENVQFVVAFDSLFGEKFDVKKQYNLLLQENVDDWEMNLFESRNAQMEFLNQYADNEKLSEEFKRFTQKSIIWNYWHLLMAYPILRSNEDTKLRYVTTLPRVMTEGLELKKVQQSDDMPLDAYRKFLPYFVTYFNSEKNKFLKYSDRVKAGIDKVTFAQEYLKDDVLDYTTTQMILEQCPYLTATAARFLVSQVYDQDWQNHLKEHCKEALNRKEEVVKKDDKTKKNSNLPKIMSLEDKPFDFSDFKGKVIYVDFWASWCGPCRKEMPFSREMHDKLTEKQKKEIIFLYISIDEDLENWKKAVEQLDLRNAGVNGHSFEMAGRYNVRTIPRYMMINKNGEVVNENASRPSSSETLPQLIELVNKK